MSYVKTEWATGDVITAQKLNNMEDGIEAVDEYAEIFTSDVSESVENWLDNHPEATTTVEDNAITTPKLQDGAVTTPKLANGSVTDDKLASDGIKVEVTDLKTDFNLTINATLIDNGIIISDGSLSTPAVGYAYTDYIEVVPNTKLKVHTILPTTTGYIAVYDGDKNFLFGVNTNNGTTNFVDLKISVPYNGKYIRCCCYTYNTDSTRFSVKYDVTVLENYLKLNAIPIDGLNDLLLYDKEGTHFPMAKYELGGMYNGSAFPYPQYNYYPNRVIEQDFLQYNKDIIVSCLSGFEFSICYYSSRNETDFTTATPWVTKTSVPANSIFRIAIHKNPEEAPNPDIYRNAIFWMFASDEKTIIDRNNDVLTNAEASCMYGINDSGVQNAKKKISLLVTTDVHGFEQGMKSAILYLNKMPFIDRGICLGDITPAYYSDTDGTWYTDIINSASKPFATILGNHDGGNGKNASQCATVAESFAKWIQPTASKIGIPTLDKPYYAINDTTHKISMVFLNSYDVPDTADGGGNFVVSRGAEVISQTQVDWLLGVLDSIPTDYTLVLFAHSFPYSNIGEAGNWTQYQTNLVGNSEACYTDLIPDIINAWKNGTSLVKTYNPQISDVSESVTINHDFSTRGAGLFACHVVGHGHRDVIAHSATYTDQKAIGLCATANDNYQNGSADLPRVMGEKSEDAITLLSIIPSYKRINLVRIGSNVSTLMVDRTMISISYD